MSFDFNERPFLVIWETTHACDLACLHCRAEADPDPAPDELQHEEALDLIWQVHDVEAPILVFSGGDPLKRNRLPELVSYAKSLKLRTGVIPAVTPLLTRERMRELKSSGLDQIAFSLDAATPGAHDAFRSVEGVFDQTLESIRLANELGLAVQINSLVNVHNQDNLNDLLQLIERLDIVFWEVFFLVPVGRGNELPLMSAEKFDEAFEKIYALSKRVSFMVKITEAPHYRRFYIEKEMIAEGLNPDHVTKGSIHLPDYLRRASGPRGSIGRAPSGVNAGKGFVFVSHQGDVMPSGFLPVSAGNIRSQSLREIYCHAPLFKALRDTTLLKGRCGICPYKEVCGGSRSRAYALTGDYLGEDPCCDYDPSTEHLQKGPTESYV